MKSIDVKGAIVSDSVAELYDWFGIEATNPKKVIEALRDTEEVEININSGGGDVFAGSEIFTALKNHKGHVTTKIVGLAASAASVIAMGGDKVLISPTAQLMIHNVSTSINGDYRDFKHASDTLKSANQSIINAYKTRLNKTDQELQKMMDNETWFNADTALAHGFVDEIMFTEDNKQFGGQLVASAGGLLLNDQMLSKIAEMMEKEKQLENQKNTALQEAKLKLMKMRGTTNEN